MKIAQNITGNQQRTDGSADRLVWVISKERVLDYSRIMSRKNTGGTKGMGCGGWI